MPYTMAGAPMGNTGIELPSDKPVHGMTNGTTDKFPTRSASTSADSYKELFRPRKSSDIMLADTFFAIGGILGIVLLIIAEAAYPDYSVHLYAFGNLSASKSQTFLMGESVGFFRAIPWTAIIRG